MKSIKLSVKSFIGFLIVAMLALAVGAAGIYGTLRINDYNSYMHENITEPMANLDIAKLTLLTTQIHVHDMVLASMTGDFALVETEFGNIGGLLHELDNYMAAYRVLLTYPEAIRFFDEARVLYENDLVPVVESIYVASQTADIYAILSGMELWRIYSDRVLYNFGRCFEIMVNEAQTASLFATNFMHTVLVVIIIALAVAVAAAIFLSLYISSMISKPIGLLTVGTANLANAGLTKELPLQGFPVLQ